MKADAVTAPNKAIAAKSIGVYAAYEVPSFPSGAQYTVEFIDKYPGKLKRPRNKNVPAGKARQVEKQ